jgi:hypothetical protein
MGAGNMKQNFQNGMRQVNEEVDEWHKVAGLRVVRMQESESGRLDAQSNGVRPNIYKSP